MGENWDLLSEESKNVIAKMREDFFIPYGIDITIKQIAGLAENASPQISQPLLAFCSAISATHETASLPFLLASSKASALHYQRIHLAERIRQLPLDPYPKEFEEKLTEAANKIAKSLADDRFKEFTNSEEGYNSLIYDIADTLIGSLKNPETKNASRELMFQSLVSIWSAFEVMIRDLLTNILNICPDLAEKILNGSSSKKHFELPKLSIDELSSSGYNLSHRMGDLILGQRDLSDLRTIRAAISSLHNEVALAEVLNNDLLWRLNQDRHIIVHRRGAVDKKYLSATGTSYEIGSVIAVSPLLLGKYFDIVLKAGSLILATFTSEKTGEPGIDKLITFGGETRQI